MNRDSKFVLIFRSTLGPVRRRGKVEIVMELKNSSRLLAPIGFS